MNMSIPLVLAHGAVNWIVTVVIVSSVLFEPLREGVKLLGTKIRGDGTRKVRNWIGEKLHYFVSCALCVGVWIGFLQAAFFSGPLTLYGFWAWTNIVTNGLLYKAIGHTILQINGLLHEKVRNLKLVNDAYEQRTSTDYPSNTINGRKSDSLSKKGA